MSGEPEILLESAQRAGIDRIIVLSSMSAYPGTRQVYGQAKLAIEELAVGIGAVAIRPGLVYGSTAGGMVGALSQATRLPVIPDLGDGARQFPIHEDDLTSALLTLLEAPHWNPEVFGVAQTTPVTLRRFMTYLAEQEGRRCRFFPLPWRLAYWSLRAAELIGVGGRLPAGSDALLGLMRPAPVVPLPRGFPIDLAAVRHV